MPMLTVAIQWIDHLLLGTAGVTIAILSVAFVGLITMQGRLPVRRGLSTIIGCFILFGAPVISAGLLEAASAPSIASLPSEAPTIVAAAAPPALPYAPVTPPLAPYDPYAGAAVPNRDTRPENDLRF